MNPCQTSKLYIDDFSAPQYKTAIENWNDNDNPYKVKIVFVALLWYVILIMMCMYIYALYATISVPIINIYLNPILFYGLIATTFFTTFVFFKISKNFWNPLKYYFLNKKYNKYKDIKDCIFQLKLN
jgi:hypothetical protein